MKGVSTMQQKVNRVEVLLSEGPKVIEDCYVIKHDEGLYIETEEKIGTNNEGGDLMQKQLVLYPWEKIISLTWTDPSLIASTKEQAILEVLDPDGELEDFLDQLEDNDGMPIMGFQEVQEVQEVKEKDATDKEATKDDTDKTDDTTDRRDDPEYNPYG